MADIDLPQDINAAVDDTPAAPRQRLSLERLKQFEMLRYGMFIHWGMSTFDGKELSSREPIGTYSPSHLDVGQWISVARDAGMKYAVLTTKHVAGHALWPSQYGTYGVNCLLDVSPDKRGLIPDRWIKPLMQLRDDLAGVGFF